MVSARLTRLLKAVPEFDFERYKEIENTPEGKSMREGIYPRVAEVFAARRQAKIANGSYRNLRMPEVWKRDERGRYTQACGYPVGSQSILFTATPHEPENASSSATAGPSGKEYPPSPGVPVSNTF